MSMKNQAFSSLAQTSLRKGKRLLSEVFVFISLWALPASADDASTPDAAATASGSPQEVAKAKHNPFGDQITVPMQLSSSLDVGPNNGTTGGLSVEPAIPVTLSEDWKLILRPNLSILATEQPNRRLGLGDIELQTYLTPAFSDKWVWGIGPDLQAPTATEPELGTGKWSAGPAVGLMYLNGPWVNGILANHVWSFAGQSSSADVSQSTLEPVISYNFQSGWFVAFDSTMTSDWKAPSDKRWTIPVGLDTGKAFQIGKQSLSLQFGTYYNIARGEGAARWLVRFQVSLVFQKKSASRPQQSAAQVVLGD
jgi:hypothetical protein